MNKELKKLYQKCIVELRGHTLTDVIDLEKELKTMKKLIDSDLKFLKDTNADYYKDGKIIIR